MRNSIENFINQFVFLKNDFTGFDIHWSGVVHFAAILLSVLFLFFLFYLIGKKFFALIFKESSFVIAVAVGYILWGTGMCLLGMVSLLYVWVVVLYCLTLFFLCIFPISRRPKINISKQLHLFGSEKKSFSLFLLLGFLFALSLRLLPPEIQADALDYHTSYPRLYREYHSMMLPAKGNESFITVPQLGEMPYIFAEFIGLSDADGYIHFGFLVLTIIALLKFPKLKKEQTILASLLFISSPLVFHIAPSAYSDITAVFLLVVAFSLFTRQKMVKRMLIVEGVLIGGLLATKIWMLVFLPGFFLYCFFRIKKEKRNSLQGLFLFTLPVISIPGVWYIRSYLISGDPFSSNNALGIGHPEHVIERFKDLFHYSLPAIKYLILDYSPVAIPGFFLFVWYVIQKKSEVWKNTNLILTLLVILPYFVLPPYYYGRYFLPGYIGTIFLFSCAMDYAQKRFVYLQYFYGFFFLGILGYFTINSLVVVPYGLGWANTDAYLSRSFTGDNATYYDFNHQFTNYLSGNETIATYGIYGYYYGDFRYKNVYYYFGEKNNQLQKLKQLGLKKLLIRGGDMEWFCKKTIIEDCTSDHYTLLTAYIPARQFLYSLR